MEHRPSAQVRAYIVGLVWVLTAGCSSEDPASVDDASKFVGTWYGGETTVTEQCPAGVDAGLDQTFGCNDPGGGPPEGSPDGGFGGFGDGGLSDMGSQTWTQLSNTELEATTPEPCTWIYSVAGNVATIEGTQTCGSVGGPLFDGNVLTLDSRTTYLLSNDGSTLTEDLHGTLSNGCTTHKVSQESRTRCGL